MNKHYDATLNISKGYCYNEECVSIEKQCNIYGLNTDTSYTLSTGCGWSSTWRTSSCNTDLQCGYTFEEETCESINGESLDIGTPCYVNNADDPPRQCVSGLLFNQCRLSTDIYTYVYIAGGWSECSIPCRDENNSTQIGYQTRRTIICAFQNGTEVDDNNCDDLYKPPMNRTCNDFVCNFCAPLIEKPNICYPNGQCDANAGLCICDPAWGGQFCDIEPSLYFMGITSHVYMNLSGLTIAERADPCNVIDVFMIFPPIHKQ